MSIQHDQTKARLFRSTLTVNRAQEYISNLRLIGRTAWKERLTGADPAPCVLFWSFVQPSEVSRLRGVGLVQASTVRAASIAATADFIEAVQALG